MTVDFNKNILPIKTPDSTQIPVVEKNTYVNSVMDSYFEEEVVEEEALPNILDDTVPKEEIEEQLQITARNLNTSYEKIKKIAEEVLKNNDAFQGRTIEQITRRELTQFITALSDAYRETRENEIQTLSEEFKQRVDTYTKAIRKGAYDNNIRKNTFDKYYNKEFLEYFEEVQRKTEEELLTIVSLANTDEERLELLDLLQNTSADSITKLCSALMQDFKTEEGKIEFAYRATDSAFITNCANGVNVFDLTVGITSQMSQDTSKEFTNKNNKRTDTFLTNNQKALESINQKIAKGEELTTEEEELLTKKLLHIDVNNGILFGINNNSNIDILGKDNITASIIQVFNEHNMLDEFTAKIADTAVLNPNVLNNTDIKEFTDRLNKLTEGKYSKAVEVAVTNLETQKMIAKSTKTNTKPEDKKGQVGFANKDNCKIPRIENIENKIKAYAVKEDSTPRIVKPQLKKEEIIITRTSGLNDYVKKEGFSTGFKQYAKDKGILTALGEAFRIMNTSDQKEVKDAYQKQNILKQAMLIQNSGVSSVNNLLAWAKDDAIEKLKGKILGTHFATKALEEKQEEIDEKKDKAYA